MAEWSPPASDAVAVADFVPPAGDAVAPTAMAPAHGESSIHSLITAIARAGVPGFSTQQVPEKPLSLEELKAQNKSERAGLSTLSRVGASFLGSEGGPTGSAINAGGESLGQLIDEGKIEYPGRVTQAAAIGAVPLGSAKGALQTAKNVGKMALAGAAGEEARSLIDEGKTSDKLATAAAIPAAITLAAPIVGKVVEGGARLAGKTPALADMSATKAATLAAAQKEGYVVPPFQVNPSGLNKTLGGIAGKAATEQEASLANQVVTNELAAKSLGLPADTEITPHVLKQVRDEAAAPYRELKDLSRQSGENLRDITKDRIISSDPHAQAVAEADPANKVIIDTLKRRVSADINELGKARDNARDAWKEYNALGGVERRQQAQNYSDRVEYLESNLDKAAASYGRPGLADELRAARTKIAKTYDVENALNTADANISAPVLGRALDKGRPLSGELKTAADFNLAFPKNTQEGARVPSPGVSKITAGLGALTGTAVGVGSHNTAAGVLASLAPEMASRATREFLLSKAGQRLLNAPLEGNAEASNLLAKVITQAQVEHKSENKSGSK